MKLFLKKLDPKRSPNYESELAAEFRKMANQDEDVFVFRIYDFYQDADIAVVTLSNRISEESNIKKFAEDFLVGKGFQLIDLGQ